MDIAIFNIHTEINKIEYLLSEDLWDSYYPQLFIDLCLIPYDMECYCLVSVYWIELHGMEADLVHAYAVFFLLLWKEL